MQEKWYNRAQAEKPKEEIDEKGNSGHGFVFYRDCSGHNPEQPEYCQC